MNGKEKAFIDNHRVARLATVDENGDPHVVPIVYAFDGETIYTPIDSKPKKVEGIKLQRVVNIRQRDSVCIIIDDYSEQWDDLVWVQIGGRAKLITEGFKYKRGIDLLFAKYSQYKEMRLSISALIVISPIKTLSWRI